MLIKPELKDMPSWLTILECDICGTRFSSSMTSAWPLCKVGIPHAKMDSETQMKWREEIIKTGDFPRLDFVRPILELNHHRRTINWTVEALPSMPNIPTVSLEKETFSRFRDLYFIQGYFIGNIVNKYNWCILDLIDYAMKHWKDVELPSENIIKQYMKP